MLQNRFNENKLTVIYNSLNYSAQLPIRNRLRFSQIYSNHFENNNPVILFIGRLTKIKKIPIILHAIYNLKISGINCNLAIVGEGEEHAKLIELSTKLSIDTNVWFYGPCRDEEKIAELIYNSKAMVSPGNVGLNAIHSLMYGTPVITHSTFSLQMPEFESIILSSTGSFFEYDSIKDLCEHIKHWIFLHDSERKIIRERAFTTIDSFFNPTYQLNKFSMILL
jgi:glycosyltransferase involved in cell wall biosynthesis